MEYKTMKQCIKEKYDTLSMQEKKVAKYIIDNYQQSILLSSAELAQQSGVSNTAVIRFAKALGFHGFLEYRREIRKEYVPAQRVYASLPLMDRDNDYVHSYFHNLDLDIQNFFQLFPAETLTEMAETIIHARRVYLMGCGCGPFFEKLSQCHGNLLHCRHRRRAGFAGKNVLIVS